MTETFAEKFLDQLENCIFDVPGHPLFKDRAYGDVLEITLDGNNPLVCVTVNDMTVCVQELSFSYLVHSTARFENVDPKKVAHYIVGLFNLGGE